MLQIEGACITMTGESSRVNEDNFLFNKKSMPLRHGDLKSPLQCTLSTAEPALFAVFDGIGGGAAGEAASSLGAEAFSREEKRFAAYAFNGKTFLSTAVHSADRAIGEETARRKVSFMGSTVAALLFMQEEVYLANVGDSKVFRLQAGQLMQLSHDHTDEQILRNLGIQKQASLLQYLGMHSEGMGVDPYLAKGQIVRGDVFLLCSDGITASLTPAELCALVTRYGNPADVVRAAVNNVRQRGGRDDATIAVLNIR